ncbi:MAG: DNA-processing protein DprA [Candidatus Melainabacteria bacterium]
MSELGTVDGGTATSGTTALVDAGNYAAKYAALLGLIQVDGIGPKTAAELIEQAGSAEAVWHAPRDWLKARLGGKTYSAFLAAREVHTDAVLTRQLAAYETLGIRLLALDDPDYPPLLKEIYDPPVLLFVRGNVSALTGKTLAMVGTRQMSEYGRQVTNKLVGELAPARVCVVSGLARGVDAQAHWQCVHYGLKTVAVFGCGLDQVYPATNEKLAQAILAGGGAWVSEYPLGTPVSRFTFPRRNRIVVGLSYGVVVVEGTPKSGALITARLALEENRNLYAVPGNLFNVGAQGPLQLIQSGQAQPVVSASEMLTDLQWACADEGGAGEPAGFAPPPADLPDGLAGHVLAAITFDPIGVDRVLELLAATQPVTTAALQEQLTLLELDGWVKSLPGSQVCRI